MTTDTVALEQEVHELLSRLGVPEKQVLSRASWWCGRRLRGR